MLNKKIATVVISSFLLLTSCSEEVTSLNQLQQVNIESKSGSYQRDVISIIKKANQEYEKRDPEIIKLKYKAMRDSAFAFYRTTGYLFYSDIKNIPSLSSNIKIPIYGDLHLENIGTYHTSAGIVSFDLNDFDDSSTGPYTWDLARCAVSIFLASDENDMDKDTRKELSDGFINDYIDALKNIRSNTSLLSQPVNYKNLTKHAANLVDDVASYSYSKFLAEITSNGNFKFNDKFIPVSNDVAKSVITAINNYASGKNKLQNFYRVKGIAYHISGKASLGRYRYAVLVEGQTAGNEDDIILEMKESSQPSISGALGIVSGNQAQRVIQSEKYFLVSPDPFLGLANINNLNFFVRRILPDDKVELTKLNKKSEFRDFLSTVALITARAHARSGKTSQILTESDNLNNKITSFAENYAKQVKDDYEVFRNSN